jgi:hypothetical protein
MRGERINGATWTIYSMGIEGNIGELYVVERDGQHIISRVRKTRTVQSADPESYDRWLS